MCYPYGEVVVEVEEEEEEGGGCSTFCYLLLSS